MVPGGTLPRRRDPEGEINLAARVYSSEPSLRQRVTPNPETARYSERLPVPSGIHLTYSSVSGYLSADKVKAQFGLEQEIDRI